MLSESDRFEVDNSIRIINAYMQDILSGKNRSDYLQLHDNHFKKIYNISHQYIQQRDFAAISYMMTVCGSFVNEIIKLQEFPSILKSISLITYSLYIPFMDTQDIIQIIMVFTPYYESLLDVFKDNNISSDTINANYINLIRTMDEHLADSLYFFMAIKNAIEISNLSLESKGDAN